jgi:hypothetical protein
MSRPTFEVSPSQYDKFVEWQEEQEVRSNAVWANKKKKGFWLPSPADADLLPGGTYEWVFVLTGIGVSCRVRNKVTGDEIDLTEYENW